MEPKSYEAHVTIEPVFGSRFDLFERVCKYFQFKPAELLLQKSREDTPERSSKDSFCTGHGTDYGQLLCRVELLVHSLKVEGFQVWRYKIEGILLDVRLPRLTVLKVKAPDPENDI